MKFLSDAEIVELKRNLRLEKNPLHVLLIETLMYTGARGGEVLGIETTDLTTDGEVVIRGLKGSNDRNLPIPPRVFAKLVKLAQERGTGKLFPITTRMLRKIWKKVQPVVGKSAHCLRHTVGVKFYKETRDVHSTGGVLGHRSIQNTMKYLNFVESQESRREAFKKIWKAS